MSTEEKKKSKKPAATAFKQQKLRAWQPILTPKPVITTFLVLGIIFIPIGAVLLAASSEVVEYTERYDDCNNSTCIITFNVDEKMEKPVYMYYRLDNYYQNHRRYVRSRNDNQLRGVEVSSYTDLEDCDPLKSKDDSRDQDNFFLPCGLIAWSLFNDTFELIDPQGEFVPLRKKGIAWSSDVDEKFNNPRANAPGIRTIADFEDEDFIVWMRTAGLPNFKKLYRIIDEDVEKGTYTVRIRNNYPVSEFDGKKYVVLSTTSWIGGKNSFLGIAYLVVGCVCFVEGLVFLFLHIFKPRRLGDTNYLDWTKQTQTVYQYNRIK